MTDSTASPLRLTTIADSFGAPGAEFTSIADLVAGTWQFGYVTNDIERAAAEMADSGFWCTEIMLSSSTPAVFLAGVRPAEIELRSIFGVRGSMVIELIEPVSGEHDVYSSLFPTDGSYAMRLHHLATLIPTGDEEWDRVGAILAQAGFSYDWTFVFPGSSTRVAYSDTRARFGHMIEICQLGTDELGYFASFGR